MNKSPWLIIINWLALGGTDARWRAYRYIPVYNTDRSKKLLYDSRKDVRPYSNFFLFCLSLDFFVSPFVALSHPARLHIIWFNKVSSPCIFFSGVFDRDKLTEVRGVFFFQTDGNATQFNSCRGLYYNNESRSDIECSDFHIGFIIESSVYLTSRGKISIINYFIYLICDSFNIIRFSSKVYIEPRKTFH